MPRPRKPGRGRQTLQQAFDTGLARLQRLKDCIAKLKLSEQIAFELTGRLSRSPQWVFERELRLLEVTEGKLDAEGVDAKHVPELAVLKHPPNDMIVILSRPGAKYEDLTESDKRTARRRFKSLHSRRLGLQVGRRCPYEWLVTDYIDAIAAATERRFSFSRPGKYSKSTPRNAAGGSYPPTGPAFETLIAALDLALFASRVPPLDTLAHIAQRHRERPWHGGLSTNQMIDLYDEAVRRRVAGES